MRRVSPVISTECVEHVDVERVLDRAYFQALNILELCDESFAVAHAALALLHISEPDHVLLGQLFEQFLPHGAIEHKISLSLVGCVL